MAIQWSGLTPELLLRLDRDSGERLPSSRELAHELGVSRGLVQECYRQLLSEGYLTSQLGSATRVATGAYPPPSGPARRPEPPPRLIADFRAGVSDLASFP